MSQEGLVTVASRHSVRETIDRLAHVVIEKGLTVFARIDHADNASTVGLKLRPTEMILLGNPRAGTVLMQESQTSGIDLPVRAVAWQDQDGKVWLTYNSATWLAERHGITAGKQAVEAIQTGLNLVSRYATTEESA